MRKFIIAIILIPTLLISDDIDPPRDNDNLKALITITVQVTFIDPVSSEMSTEKIEETTEGQCFVNPVDPTEILCL